MKRCSTNYDKLLRNQYLLNPFSQITQYLSIFLRKSFEIIKDQQYTGASSIETKLRKHHYCMKEKVYAACKMIRFIYCCPFILPCL